MRSKEEIAIIAAEIKKNVDLRIRIEDYSCKASKLAKIYWPQVMHTIAIANMGPACSLKLRNLSAVLDILKTKETFERYRESVGRLANEGSEL